MNRYCILLALASLGLLGSAAAAVPDGRDEVTSLVRLRPPRVISTASGKTNLLNLRMSNRSPYPIQGPLGVVVQVQKPAGAGLTLPSGSLADGSGYLELRGAEEVLEAGETFDFSLLFDNPEAKRLRYRLLPYGGLPSLAGPPAAGRSNVTGMVKISLTQPRYDRRTQTYRSRLRLTNVSDRPISAPLSLAFPDLQPATASLLAATETDDGTPFVDVPLAGGSLAPGAKSPALALQFANPERAKLLLQPLLYGILAAAGGAGSDPLFNATNPWNQSVAKAPLRNDSQAIIDQLKADGGWGMGNTMRIDFSIHVLEADGTPPRSFTPNGNFYSPDCDQVPFPVPALGAVEGEDGYACSQGGDCHLLVVDRAAAKLYEMYSADISGGHFSGGCAVVWDLNRSYPAELRGDQCTSADAAGLPIAALLFSADEIAAGSIDHAIRFILPNSRMRAKAYVRPATHAGAPSSQHPAAIPYGSRLRLRADYPLETLSAAAQVVAKAMQRYGMILADGGNMALTARSDRFTQHKWDEVGIADSYALEALQVDDFEVVDSGATIPLTYDCARNGF